VKPQTVFLLCLLVLLMLAAAAMIGDPARIPASRYGSASLHVAAGGRQFAFTAGADPFGPVELRRRTIRLAMTERDGAAFLIEFTVTEPSSRQSPAADPGDFALLRE
jgi:hypothetical protein